VTSQGGLSVTNKAMLLQHLPQHRPQARFVFPADTVGQKQAAGHWTWVD
jgi:hypothetical protein